MRGYRIDIQISFCLTKRYKKHKNAFCALCAFLWLKLNDSTAHTDRDRLRTIGSAELFHDVFDVDLDSFFRDEEFFRNVSIAIAFGDCSKHFNLPPGES